MRRFLKAPNNSITNDELKMLVYPVYGSPKIDGFRCGIDNIPKTSSMKPMPNPFVMRELAVPELNGLDGEIVVGNPADPNSFNISTGPLRRHYGEPDFHFFVFDNFLLGEYTYSYRWLKQDVSYLDKYPRITVLTQVCLHSPEAVIQYEKACTLAGYEGAMIRTASGKYKQGRATFNEMNIFKRKPFIDTEGIIVGFTEQMTNLNEAYTDEMGLTKRKSNKGNKVGAGTLGNFILKAKEWEKSFACGGGKLTHSERLKIWENKELFLGRKVTFKYQKHGSINAPRSPIFLRFFTKL